MRLGSVTMPLIKKYVTQSSRIRQDVYIIMLQMRFRYVADTLQIRQTYVRHTLEVRYSCAINALSIR